MALLNRLTLRCSSKIYIVAFLCCYVALLGVIALTHDHCEHEHSEDTCTACVYNSQHVAVELETSLLASPFLIGTTFPFYETTFFPLKQTTNVRSRAPPVFSNTLSDFVC